MDTTVSNGQTYSPRFQVNDDDTLSVVNGGTADGVDVNSGGDEDVYSGGTAIHTFVHSGGGQVVQGHATSTVVDGGMQSLINNGSAFTALAEETLLVSGGRQEVFGDTSASDTTIDLGGQQDVNGGIARTTHISGGIQNVFGGQAFDTTVVGVETSVVVSGSSVTTTQFGQQRIVSGGSVDGTVVGSGGIQLFYEGSSATNTLVVSGGAQYVNVFGDDEEESRDGAAPGAVVSGTIVSGGTAEILAEGTALDTRITGTSDAQGLQQVDTSGSAAGVVVDAFGLLLIQSGGSASEVTINAGTADLEDGAIITTRTSGTQPTITFGDGAGALVIEHPQGQSEPPVAEASLADSTPGGSYQFEPSLTTFGPGDSIDLTQFVYTSGATAILTGSTLDVIEGGATVAEFQLVNPGSTTFKVTDDGRASHGTLITADTPPSQGGGGGGGGGGGAPTGGGTVAPPSNNGTSPPSNNSTDLSVAFNPKVSVAPGDIVTLSGTYAGTAGVPSILISEDGSPLGVATVNPDGTWSLTIDYTDLPGPHTDITATATDAQGRQATGKSPYNLITDYSHVKPDGYPYRTVQDNFDPTSGAYTGSVFFNRNGTEYYESSYKNTADGGSIYTYSGGTYFKKKGYSSFSDSYDVQNIDIYNTDGKLTSHTETNRDGTRIVYVYGRNATLDAAPASTHYVFDPGLGHVTIGNFSANGPGHDSIETSNVSPSRLAAVLLAQPDADGNLDLHLGHGNVVTLLGIDHVTKRDFTHPA